MNSEDNIKTAGKIPELNTDNFMIYEVLIVAWLKRFHSSDRALREDAPTFEIDDYAETLDDDGEDTEQTAVLREAHNEAYRMWQKRNDIAYSSIVESCQHNPTAMLLILETQSTNAKTLWQAIVKKFNLQHLSIKQRELAKFNSLMIEENESLSKFVNRLKQGKLNLKNLGHAINDDVELLGRLKTGISKDKRFKHIVSNLTFGDFTWEEAVNRIDLMSTIDGLDNTDEIQTGTTKETNAKSGPETARYTGNRNGQSSKPKSYKANQNNQGNNGKFKNKNNNNGNYKLTKESFQGNCNFCGKYGHKEKDCRIKQTVVRLGKPNPSGNKPYNKTNNEKNNKRMKCYACDSNDHWTSDCTLVKEIKNKRNQSTGSTSNDFEYGFMIKGYETRSTSSKEVKRHEGVIDSGASSHLLKKSSVGYSKIDEQPIIIGTALQGATLEGEGRTDIRHLKESIVIKDDDLAMNLVSVAKLDIKGLTTIFKGGVCRVIDEDKNTVIATGILRDGQYFVDIREFQHRETTLLASVAPPVNDILWHNRLGHVHHRKICHAVSKNLIRGIKYPLKNTSRTSPICAACAAAKATRFAFSKKKPKASDKDAPDNEDNNDLHYQVMGKPTAANSDVHSDTESDQEEHPTEEEHLPSPLRRKIPCISTDIKGPLRIAGRSGEQYYQGFIETDTKYLYSFAMATKDLALKNLEQLMELIINAQGQRLVRYHSDGAPELISAPLVKYLATHECMVSFSPPYMPERNSLKERNHRTLFESAHAMLSACMLNISFWFYAITYSTRIYNRMPTTTKYGYMSPVQAKFGVIPSVRRYKKFGCLAYVHIPATTREKGLVDKTYKGYFVGIDDKTSAYMIYCIELDQIKISDSVIFDEVTVLQRQMEAEFTLDPVPKSINDFYYLIGMLYIDDEDGMKYITTRVVRQRGLIVTYRAPYSSEAMIGSEETRPIHVADAAIMVLKYQTEHPPIVMQDAGKLLPIVGVRDIEAPMAKKPISRSSGTVLGTGRDTGINDELEDGSGSTASPSPNLNTLEGWIAPAAPVKAGVGPDQPEQRTPRLRDRPRTIINVGKLGDVTHVANLTFNNHEYIYYMTNFTHADEHAFAASHIPQNEDNVWMESSLAELKSIILVHNCWEYVHVPHDFPHITLKWVHTIKSDGRN
jgi:hypothetical protein